MQVLKMGISGGFCISNHILFPKKYYFDLALFLTLQRLPLRL